MEANNNPGAPYSPAPAGPTPQPADLSLAGRVFTYDCLNPRGGQRTETMQIYSPRAQVKMVPTPPLTDSVKQPS